MAKYTHVLRQDRHDDGRRRRGPWPVLVVLALLASPLIYEGGKVCVARWRSMLGAQVEAETPIWDQVVRAYESGADEWYYRVGRGIEPGQWSAGMAIPAAIAVAYACTYFLRNGSR